MSAASINGLLVPQAVNVAARRDSPAGQGDGDAWLRAIAAARDDVGMDRRADARRLFELESAAPRPIGQAGGPEPTAPARTPFSAASSLRWAVAEGPDQPMQAAATATPIHEAPPPSTLARPTISSSTGREPILSANDARDAGPSALAGPSARAGAPAIAGAVSSSSSSPVRQSVEATDTGFVAHVAPELPPVRVHVQWHGREADVWVGLHRSLFDQLPGIRAAIVLWLDARSGTLRKLTCNGDVLEMHATAPSFQGET